MAKEYQCLEYAVERFVEEHGYNPVEVPNQPNAYAYWENIPEENRHMHIQKESIAIWKNNNNDTGYPGHAGYIEKIDRDGTIHFAHANVNGDKSVHYETFSDPYYMSRGMGKKLTFVGYVK